MNDEDGIFGRLIRSDLDEGIIFSIIEDKVCDRKISCSC